MKIYSVEYGNYFPPEVDSMYQHENDANRRCEELNSKSDTDMWEVYTRHVRDKFEISE